MPAAQTVTVQRQVWCNECQCVAEFVMISCVQRDSAMKVTTMPGYFLTEHTRMMSISRRSPINAFPILPARVAKSALATWPSETHYFQASETFRADFSLLVSCIWQQAHLRAYTQREVVGSRDDVNAIGKAVLPSDPFLKCCSGRPSAVDLTQMHTDIIASMFCRSWP